MPSKIIEGLSDQAPYTVFVPAFADHTEDGKVLIAVGHGGVVASPQWARSFAAQLAEEADLAEAVGRTLAQGIEARSGETALAGSTGGESPVAESDAP